MKNTVKMSSVELVNADCLQYLPSLPDNSIDLIITDPPYFRVKPNGWDNQWKGDDVVADFFMGSGSTIKAAMTLGRRAIGVELETERFIQTAEEICKLDKK